MVGNVRGFSPDLTKMLHFLSVPRWPQLVFISWWQFWQPKLTTLLICPLNSFLFHLYYRRLAQKAENFKMVITSNSTVWTTNNVCAFKIVQCYNVVIQHLVFLEHRKKDYHVSFQMSSSRVLTPEIKLWPKSHGEIQRKQNNQRQKCMNLRSFCCQIWFQKKKKWKEAKMPRFDSAEFASKLDVQASAEHE